MRLHAASSMRTAIGTKERHHPSIIRRSVKFFLDRRSALPQIAVVASLDFLMNSDGFFLIVLWPKFDSLFFIDSIFLQP